MTTPVDPQPGYTGGPQSGYDARPTSVAAIVGLIGAFVFWPVGLVASIIGISHTKPGRKKGRGIAIAGLVVSIVAAVVAIAVIVAIAEAASSPSVQQAVEDAASSASEAASDPAAAAAPGDSAAPEQSQAPAAGSAEADVVVDSCEVGSLGLVQGEVTVTNSTDSDRSYLVTISANDSDGNRVSELNGAANSIAPGQSATVQVVGTASDDAPDDLTCVVASVSRI